MASSISKIFGPKTLSRLEWRLSREMDLSGDELADAIEANPDQLIPNGVRAYLCRLLRGTLKRKPGPKQSPMTKKIYELVAFEYQEELARIQAERKGGGKRAAKSDKTPHIEAAEIVQRRYNLGHITPQRLANIMSSRKSV